VSIITGTVPLSLINTLAVLDVYDRYLRLSSALVLKLHLSFSSPQPVPGAQMLSRLQDPDERYESCMRAAADAKFTSERKVALST
jgi:hypothetical protein